LIIVLLLFLSNSYISYAEQQRGCACFGWQPAARRFPVDRSRRYQRGTDASLLRHHSSHSTSLAMPLPQPSWILGRLSQRSKYEYVQIIKPRLSASCQTPSMQLPSFWSFPAIGGAAAADVTVERPGKDSCYRCR